MKHLYILLLCFLTTSVAKAQSLTANEFPAIDDTLKMWTVSDTSNIVSPSKNMATWDYTSLKLDKSKSLNYKFIKPSTATNGAKFTTSNIACEEPGQPANTVFYNRTSNSVEVVGVNNLTGSALPYSDKEKWLIYPLNAINGSSSDTYGGSAPGLLGSQTIRNGSIVTEGYGFGELKLPGKTYKNAILVRLESNYTDSLKSTFGSIATVMREERFLWFVSGNRGWVFEIKNTATSIGVGGQTQTKTVYMRQAQDSLSNIGFNQISTNDFVVVYPNPTSNLLNVVFNVSTPMSSYIYISDIAGKKVYESDKIIYNQETNSFIFNTESLTSGIYFININQKVVKFVKN